MVRSIESPDRSYCVDFFERPAGGFGYEQFRADPEDGGSWTPISGFAARHFESVDAALTDARLTVSWLLQALPTVVMSAGREFEVVVSSGSLSLADGVRMSHRWTSGGVIVQTEFTGAHLYHLAAAGCVLNDVYRESDRLGLAIDGVRVCAFGSFDPLTWASNGVVYEVEVASESSDADIDRLLTVVDEVAEIPKALRSGTTVIRHARD